MFRKENGVTLVALVITIIVLLILAGVTISMVLGQDGIVKQATKAGEAQENATVKDHAISAMAAAYTRKLSGVDSKVKTTVDTVVIANSETIQQLFAEELHNMGYTIVTVPATDISESGTVSITATNAKVKNGYTFTITISNSTVDSVTNSATEE